MMIPDFLISRLSIGEDGSEALLVDICERQLMLVHESRGGNPMAMPRESHGDTGEDTLQQVNMATAGLFMGNSQYESLTNVPYRYSKLDTSQLILCSLY